MKCIQNRCGKCILTWASLKNSSRSMVEPSKHVLVSTCGWRAKICLRISAISSTKSPRRASDFTLSRARDLLRACFSSALHTGSRVLSGAVHGTRDTRLVKSLSLIICMHSSSWIRPRSTVGRPAPASSCTSRRGQKQVSWTTMLKS